MQASANELNSEKLMLINLKNDNAERRNEADKNPQIVARLKQQYLEWIKEVQEQQ